jgi:hypothetical protein
MKARREIFMKKFLIGTAVCSALVLTSGGLSFAQMDGFNAGCGNGFEEHRPLMRPMMRGEAPGMHMPVPPPLLPEAADRILDEKQKESIRDIELKANRNSIRKIAELELAELDLREILDKDSADLGKVEAGVRKVESLRVDMQMIHIKAREEVKTILSPEQKNKLKELTSTRRHGMESCEQSGR